VYYSQPGLIANVALYSLAVLCCYLAAYMNEDNVFSVSSLVFFFLGKLAVFAEENVKDNLDNARETLLVGVV